MAQWLGSPAGWTAAVLLLVLLLAYLGASRPIWVAAAAAWLIGYTAFAEAGWATRLVVWVLVATPLVIVNVPPVSRALFSRRLLHAFRPALRALGERAAGMPSCGAAESWAAELLRGRPRWRREPRPEVGGLSSRERRFLDAVVERTCRRLSEADPTRPLPDRLFRLLAQERFFGLTVPTRLGGRELSASAYQSTLVRLASCHPGAACLVAQANSAGAHALLARVVADDQADGSLRQLARGERYAALVVDGSCAGTPDAIVARGRIVRQADDPSGLAVELRWPSLRLPGSADADFLVVPADVGDPDGLLSDRVVGPLRCLAVVGVDAAGVASDAAVDPDDPRGAPAWRGEGVCAGLSAIRGLDDGVDVLDSLAEVSARARAVALPALLAGFAKRATREAGDMARVRQVAGESAGDLPVVQGWLARMGALTHGLDSLRPWLRGEPDAAAAFPGTLVQPVLSADIAELVGDGVRGRLGTPCPWPDALAAMRGTLEWLQGVFGADPVLTDRALFPAGLLACHPQLARLVEAAHSSDAEGGERLFDRALVAHAGHVLRNTVRSLLLGLTAARLAPVGRRRRLRAYHRRLVRYSAALAMTTDLVVMAGVRQPPGRPLRDTRLAEAWARLYASWAVVATHESGGTEDDAMLVHWYWGRNERRIQRLLLEAARNLPGPVLPRLTTRLIFPFGLPRPRRDRFDTEVAALLMAPTSARDRLSRGLHLSADGQLARLDTALDEVFRSQSLESKLREARRLRLIEPGDRDSELRQALAGRVLTDEEYQRLRRADTARWRAVVGVD